jgi:hypothetical protein
MNEETNLHQVVEDLKDQPESVLTTSSDEPAVKTVIKDEKSMRKLFTHEKKLYQLCKNKIGGSFNRRCSILRTVQVLRSKLGLKEVELKDYI